MIMRCKHRQICLTGKKTKIDLIKSDVLQFFLADGTKISVRPSGTEPKIKFYFSVNTKLDSADKFDETEKILDKRIDDVIRDMKLALVAVLGARVKIKMSKGIERIFGE